MEGSVFHTLRKPRNPIPLRLLAALESGLVDIKDAEIIYAMLDDDLSDQPEQCPRRCR